MDYGKGADCNENTVQDFSSTSISRDQVELALAGAVLVAAIVVIAAPIVAAGLATLTAGADAGVAAGVGLFAGGVLTVMNEVDDMNGW